MNLKDEAFFRDQLIGFLIQVKGYPQGLIAKEILLSHALLSSPSSHLKRRADILVYKKHGEQLNPFFLIECKKDRLTEQAARQLLGYNHSLKAPFIALACPTDFWFANQEEGVLRRREIPSYEELLSF